MAAQAISYQLLIELARPVTVTVGRLGTFRFAAGRYVYTGSARRNLEARIARHLRAEKTLRWHIDYLLAAAGTCPSDRGGTAAVLRICAKSSSIALQM